METVRVIALSPYHKVYGLLVPDVAQRMLEALNTMGDEEGVGTAQFMSLLWSQSSDALLLAAIGPTGKVRGFCAATFDKGQVFMIQPRMDEPAENDPVADMIDAVAQWALTKKVNRITMLARRAEPKWLKKHGFVVERYVMVKSLDEVKELE